MAANEGAPTASDPFDCFGDDDSDSDNNDTDDGGPQQNPSASSSSSVRDPACGVLTFHSGTEQSLCHYVEQALEKRIADATNNTSTISQQVLQCIDQFCYSRHWMMHVGDQKGLRLKEFLLKFWRYHPDRISISTQRSSTTSVKTIVELGTYCGYSSILMAQTILASFDESQPTATSQSKNNNNNNNTNNFHIYSVDVDPHHQAVAQKLVKMAQLEQYITFILLDVNTPSLVAALQEKMTSQTTAAAAEKIDFLFIDHDKDLYCSDLEQLEQSGMIQPGTHVAADNVVFFDTPYRSLIETRKEQGMVSSRLVMGQLEYIIDEELQGLQQQQQANKKSPGAIADTVRDGIGKFLCRERPRTRLFWKFPVVYRKETFV